MMVFSYHSIKGLACCLDRGETGMLLLKNISRKGKIYGFD